MLYKRGLVIYQFTQCALKVKKGLNVHCIETYYFLVDSSLKSRKILYSQHQSISLEPDKAKMSRMRDPPT